MGSVIYNTVIIEQCTAWTIQCPSSTETVVASRAKPLQSINRTKFRILRTNHAPLVQSSDLGGAGDKSQAEKLGSWAY
jgi:hypothetical protein